MMETMAEMDQYGASRVVRVNVTVWPRLHTMAAPCWVQLAMAWEPLMPQLQGGGPNHAPQMRAE